jgi:putative MFS transporter
MSDSGQRLERLPFGRFHLRLLLVGGAGFTFEAVDVAIVAFIYPVLRSQWHLSTVEIGFLASSTYVGYAVGALLAGMLGDRFGRRIVMMTALAAFCVAAVANAFAQNWAQFLVLRIIGGIGMGAEAAIIAPYLSEFISAEKRGRFIGSLATFFSFGFVLAALIGYLVIPVSANGWRYALILTGLPVVMILWWRRTLVESPRWLESRGRHAEAEAIVFNIERGFIQTGHSLTQPRPGDFTTRVSQRASVIDNFRQLWAPKLRKVTIMSWLLWFAITFCNYSFFTWIPSLLVERGMTVSKSFSFSIIIYLAQIPGYVSASLLTDKIGRQATIVTYMAGAAMTAVALSLVQNDEQFVGFSILLSFFINGMIAGQYAYTPEIFPTAVRATGVGTASAIGRLGGITSPILVGYVYPVAGFTGVFGMTTAVLIVGALSVLLLGVSTRGRALEEIEHLSVGVE